jgi:RNase P subunit RPR2
MTNILAVQIKCLKCAQCRLLLAVALLALFRLRKQAEHRNAVLCSGREAKRSSSSAKRKLLLLQLSTRCNVNCQNVKGKKEKATAATGDGGSD